MSEASATSCGAPVRADRTEGQAEGSFISGLCGPGGDPKPAPDSPPAASGGCCPPPTEPCCPGNEEERYSPGTRPLGDSPCRAQSTPPSPSGDRERESPGYHLCAFVEGWLDTPAGPVPRVSSRLDRWDVFGRWLMRWGVGRDRYRIAPGLYAVGNPNPASPVLVTANYKMTFDVLRRDLADLDAWVLVLETHGINVWCAAGKGSFGTDEVVRRIRESRLGEVVEHRKLILPQLGAPGVSAHEVRRQSGFSVAYGPVRARDIQRYLRQGMAATPEMRAVTFTTLERLVLTPVELSVIFGRPVLWLVLALLLIGGIGPTIFSPAAALVRGAGALGVVLAGILAGAVLTPVLLPWLPWRPFAAKGAVAGAGLAAMLAIGNWGTFGWLEICAVLLAVPAVSSYCAMNFTGATPFTSPSGVEREMRRAIPAQAVAGALAVALWVGGAF